MPEENNKLTDIIKEEIAPVKKEMELLKEQAITLETTNAELSSKLELKDAETKSLTELKESLTRENQAKATLVEKLKRENESLKLENLDLKKQIVPLKKNYLALKEKHTKLLEKLPILENRIKLAEIELKNKLTASVEKHLKEIIPNAFSRAQHLFESKFQPIETNMLKEIGSIVGPYISEDRDAFTEKINTLEKAILTIKEQNNKQSKNITSLDAENKKLQTMLKEANNKVEKASLEIFKSRLVEKAPENLKSIISEKLKPATDTEKCKTVFVETVKRSTASKETKPNHPVEEIRISKSNTPTIKKNIEDSDIAPNDPELFKLAGLED